MAHAFRRYKQARLDLGGAFGKEREVNARAVPGRAERG